MRARIDARFATAKETANALGVPTSRVKKLVRLTSPTFRGKNNWPLVRVYTAEMEGKSPKRNHRVPVHVEFKASKANGKTGSPKRKAAKKSGTSGTRHARGKVAKAAR
jgi:hypothetical protein